MIQLLQARKLDKQFNYQLEKGGNTYSVGATNCKCEGGLCGGAYFPYVVRGDLFSIQTSGLTKAEKSSTPALWNIPDVVIASDEWKQTGNSLDTFVEAIGKNILAEHRVRMSPEDLKQFFKRVHEHYMDFV
jgi:hypothetical protein